MGVKSITYRTGDLAQWLKSLGSFLSSKNKPTKITTNKQTPLKTYHMGSVFIFALLVLCVTVDQCR